MNLGFGARKCINDLKKSDLVSNKEVTSYLNECITFVTIIVFRLFEKGPLGSVVVRNADAFDPNVIANLEVHELQKRVKTNSNAFIEVENTYRFSIRQSFRSVFFIL